MHIGSDALGLDIPEGQLLEVRFQPPVPPLADIPGAVRSALENPIHFPPLRRALTPDDHVVIVVDESIADLARFVVPLLEDLAEARITPDAITLLCPAPDGRHEWAEQLGDAFRNVKIEEHDPHNRKRLSYLATTKQGRRVYLNRTAVDADQLVVLSRRYYDPMLGIGGGAAAIFPALSDAETQEAFLSKLSMDAPGKKPWPVHEEAAEVAWLLGAPFFIQVIEGPGDEIIHVIGGLVETSAEGEGLLNARWRGLVDELANVIIAEVSGDPVRHTFADLARALACASCVLVPEGRIVLLNAGSPALGPGASVLRQADTATEALRLLKHQVHADLPAAFQWASAAKGANLYILSDLASDVVEELFATPLDNASQVQRLLGDGRCLFLPDADKSLVVVDKPASKRAP
jgi:nickel-dependent lactate racemase